MNTPYLFDDRRPDVRACYQCGAEAIAFAGRGKVLCPSCQAETKTAAKLRSNQKAADFVFGLTGSGKRQSSETADQEPDEDSL